MKKITALILALLLVFSTASCSSGGAGTKTTVKSLTEPFFGEWVNRFDDEGAPAQAILGDGTLTIGDTSYTFSWKDADSSVSADGSRFITFNTTPEPGGSCFIVSIFLSDDEPGSHHILSVSKGTYHKDIGEALYDSDSTYYETFLFTDEFTEVTLNSDNWTDYLTLKREIIPYKDETGAIYDLYLDYILVPADPNVSVEKADLTVTFDYSAFICKELLYDPATGKYMLSDEFILDDFIPAGSETRELNAYDFEYDYSGLLYTSSADFEQAGDLYSVNVYFPLNVEISQLEGTVLLLGTPDTSFGGITEEQLKWREEAEAAMQSMETEDTAAEAQNAGTVPASEDVLGAHSLQLSGNETGSGIKLSDGCFLSYRYDNNGILTGLDLFKLYAYADETDEELAAYAADDNIGPETVVGNYIGSFFKAFGKKTAYKIEYDDNRLVCLCFSYSEVEDEDFMYALQHFMHFGMYIEDDKYVGDALNKMFNHTDYLTLEPAALFLLYSGNPFFF